VGSFENGEPPIGVSIFIAVQNYNASGNEGIPKSIRGNINCCAIWKTGNLKELDLSTTELSGVLPKEKILKACMTTSCTKTQTIARHNFLFQDLTKKNHYPSPSRFKGIFDSRSPLQGRRSRLVLPLPVFHLKLSKQA
jgi:hypothetical protein